MMRKIMRGRRQQQQRGRGMLSSLLNVGKKYAKQVLKTVGKQALNTALKVGKDVMAGRRKPKEALLHHGKQTLIPEMKKVARSVVGLQKSKKKSIKPKTFF